MKIIFGILAISLMTSCASFVGSVEKAHAKRKLLKNDAIQADIVVNFGGKKYLNAKVTFATDSSKGKIEYSDGRVSIFEGDKVYYSPNVKNKGGIRFDSYTWVYFQLLAYKLQDQGVILADYKNSKLSETYETKKLSFVEGTGDASEDWYVLYRNKKTSLLDAAAYIVTFGKTKEEAQKDPHAIKYENYKLIDGVPVAQSWSFWGWTEKDEFTKQIGNAKLESITFVKTDSNTFKPKKNFILYK